METKTRICNYEGEEPAKYKLSVEIDFIKCNVIWMKEIFSPSNPLCATCVKAGPFFGCADIVHKDVRYQHNDHKENQSTRSVVTS